MIQFSGEDLPPHKEVQVEYVHAGSPVVVEGLGRKWLSGPLGIVIFPPM